MRSAAILALVLLTSACVTEEVPVEIPVAVFGGSEVAAPLPPDAPASDTVDLNGKTYSMRFLPGGGIRYTRRPTDQIGPDGHRIIEEGNFVLDALRIGGAGDKLEAVAVYLHICKGIDAVDPVWGDEIVPRDPTTGDFEFSYPDLCPTRYPTNT